MPSRKKRQAHWNATYKDTPTNQLGWYEEAPGPSLDLITECDLPTSARILDAGSGATTLIDALIDRGYADLVAVDISEVALQRLQARLAPEEDAPVQWIVGDLTDPDTLASVDPVDVWHDRAVLHFLTDAADRAAYVQSLRSVVKPGGYVIIAAFALDGATRCSGLDVRNYDASMISNLLGPDFEMEQSLNHTYHQPSGAPRPYVYTRFRRVNAAADPA
ncbi:MAG: class I SAM-dependent methyltransferase [Longimonas sp.]|uniref:class I SAM-dependent methyltransferase n=1 Tax=Longimonas sp. TaxID=2039626 RepID=UPI003975FAA7